MQRTCIYVRFISEGRIEATAAGTAKLVEMSFSIILDCDRQSLDDAIGMLGKVPIKRESAL